MEPRILFPSQFLAAVCTLSFLSQPGARQVISHPDALKAAGLEGLCWDVAVNFKVLHKSSLHFSRKAGSCLYTFPKADFFFFRGGGGEERKGGKRRQTVRALGGSV